MNVLLINGSPNEFGCTYTALAEVAGALQRRGMDTRILHVGKKPIAGCLACNGCGRTGKCVIGDAVNDILAGLDGIDAIVVGSPVYYAAASGQITSFLDRLFYSAGGRMAGKVGACVVSCRRGGASTAFDQLNKYFSINNMPIAPSQYWNQVHGYTPDDVRKDEEGLQTMRALGENMAWLLQSIQAGRDHGVQPPQYEPRLKTNFIR